MFTGIIEETGIVHDNSRGRIIIRARKVLRGTAVGDSIAVNGVCLTVTDISDSTFTADIMPETFRRTNLECQKNGSIVNLERAMRADGRFGGHIVSGHIDGTGTVEKITREKNVTWIFIRCEKKILSLIMEKGSVTIDGISLTVARVGEESFAVSIIPHTGSETNILAKKIGDRVNLENDIVGKYVQRLLAGGGTCGERADGQNAGEQNARDEKIMSWLSE